MEQYLDPHEHSQSPLWRIFRIGALFIVLGAIAFSFSSVVRSAFISENTPLPPDIPSDVIQTSGVSVSDMQEKASSQAQKTEVLGEQNEVSPSALRSERFRLDQVSIAGDITLSEDNSDLGKLEIPFVRGESFLEKNKKDAKVLITWKTSKAARSKLVYSKNNNADFAKTIEEEGYGTDHSIVISGLEQASTYVYSIAARDHGGQEVSTDSYAVYTGTKTASLFDLISGAIVDVFGWTMKK